MLVIVIILFSPASLFFFLSGQEYIHCLTSLAYQQVLREGSPGFHGLLVLKRKCWHKKKMGPDLKYLTKNILFISVAATIVLLSCWEEICRG